MSKKALITGIAGQDGSYLTEFLLSKGYEVHGIVRWDSVFTTQKIDHLYQDPHINGVRMFLHYGDLTDTGNIEKLINQIKPDEVYHLAAMSHVRVSFDMPEYTVNTDALGTLRVLEAIKNSGLPIKFYMAASVTFDTPVLIRKDGVIKRTIFGATKNFKNFEVLSINKESKEVKFLPVKKVINHGIKPVYEISGTTGLKIKLTPDHSVMVFDDNGNIVEKRTSELKEGDFLITFSGDIFNERENIKKIKFQYTLNDNIPSRWGYPNRISSKLVSSDLELTDDLMRVAGYYLAEGSSYIQKGRHHKGSVNYRVSFCFGGDENERVQDTIQTIDSIFGFNPSNIQTRQSSFTINYSSKALYTFFSMFGHNAKDKRLPDFIWQVPKELIKEFLYGYAGDAYFKEKGQIRYTTVNKELAIDINYLMRVNDICTYYGERFNKAHLSPQRTLIKAGTCYDIEVPTYSNFIFPQIVTKFKHPSSKCLPTKIFQQESFYNEINDKNLVSKGRIKRFIENNRNVFDKNLSQLINSNLGVIKIKNIIYKGEESVGDYEVPGSECFFCGNQPILAHNSSEMFGSSSPPQNENTPFHPRSPYACAKVFSYYITRFYREAYGIFACNGVLFNHESPRRGPTFVTKKITRAIARIKAGLDKKIYLGNLDAKRDWGFAPEYVEAMWLMFQQSKPDDYVIATGETHSVREFLEEAFKYVGLGDWRSYVEIDPRYFRPAEVEILVGDASKAREKLGWQPKIKFKELARIMIDGDFKELGLIPPGEGDKILKEKFPNRWWKID